MAGAGTRLFEAGSILTANQVNTYLMDQVVARFATLEDRDLAFGGATQPALAEGRLCYLDSTNKVYIYTGSDWEEIGSQIEAGEVGTTELADSSVTTAKILNGTILNEDISSSASIALSKLATGALPAAITVASINIVNGTIVNDDISTSAAISLSKLGAGSLPSTIEVNSLNIVNNTIVNDDISASASIVDTKLATIATTGKVSNSATTATNANTASAIVARDASGNFTAGTITATLVGNVTGTASNASKINNRTIFVQTATPTAIATGDIWFQVAGF
jgi:hypothetical protein